MRTGALRQQRHALSYVEALQMDKLPNYNHEVTARCHAQHFEQSAAHLSRQ